MRSADAIEIRQLRHNIFFALYPPVEVAAGISRFADRLVNEGRLRGSRVARERLHITLNPLGGYPVLPQLLIGAACEAVSKLKTPSFVLALNRVMSFKNKSGLRPRVLTGDEGLFGVFMLYSAIHAALAQAGIALGAETAIMPHLTVSRENDMAPDDFIDPVSWRVREFCLIHSPYGQSRHNVLGRWPLAA